MQQGPEWKDAKMRVAMHRRCARARYPPCVPPPPHHPPPSAPSCAPCPTAGPQDPQLAGALPAPPRPQMHHRGRAHRARRCRGGGRPRRHHQLDRAAVAAGQPGADAVAAGAAGGGRLRAVPLRSAAMLHLPAGPHRLRLPPLPPSPRPLIPPTHSPPQRSPLFWPPADRRWSRPPTPPATPPWAWAPATRCVAGCKEGPRGEGPVKMGLARPSRRMRAATPRPSCEPLLPARIPRVRPAAVCETAGVGMAAPPPIPVLLLPKLTPALVFVPAAARCDRRDCRRGDGCVLRPVVQGEPREARACLVGSRPWCTPGRRSAAAAPGASLAACSVHRCSRLRRRFAPPLAVERLITALPPPARAPPPPPPPTPPPRASALC